MVYQKQKQKNNLCNISSIMRSVVKKTGFVCLFLMVFGVTSYADEILEAKITGDRVNVRTKPSLNSEVIMQLNFNDKIEVLEQGEEWTKIKGPTEIKVWVHDSCITDNKIAKRLVNMRSGPGQAYCVLSRLERGTPVTIVEEFGEWKKIVPPVDFNVWVTSEYVGYGETVQEIVKEEPVKKLAVLDKPVSENKIDSKEGLRIISVPNQEISDLRLVSYAGKLEDLGVLINRPGTFKLVSKDNKWLCIIRSNTLDVNPYVNRTVRIEGVILSEVTTWNVPVIELKRLCIIK